MNNRSGEWLIRHSVKGTELMRVDERLYSRVHTLLNRLLNVANIYIVHSTVKFSYICYWSICLISDWLCLRESWIPHHQIWSPRSHKVLPCESEIGYCILDVELFLWLVWAGCYHENSPGSGRLTDWDRQGLLPLSQAIKGPSSMLHTAHHHGQT